jgi:nucleoside phosphorylase
VLIVVPTAVEADALGTGAPGPVILCGFGLAAAGAGTAVAIAAHPSEAAGGVVLIGAAGTYDPARAAVGTAFEASSVAVHGIGARGRTPAALGFADTDTLPLPGPGEGLLSVSEASADPVEARSRARAHPGAVAEEMEGFAAALAARGFGVPIRIVRGISNVAGDGDTSRWRLADALAAARRLVGGWP